MASDVGYFIACKQLKTDIFNIGHVAMLASVTVVDLCTKYAVLMNKTVIVQQQNNLMCMLVRPNL